jgi:hypothetical protein
MKTAVEVVGAVGGADCITSFAPLAKLYIVDKRRKWSEKSHRWPTPVCEVNHGQECSSCFYCERCIALHEAICC